MKQLSDLLDTVLHDRDLSPDSVPGLDLYMDQVLTLFNEGLQENKRHPDDKLLTKTMINNYSLADVKALTGREDVDFEACFNRFLTHKDRLRAIISSELAPYLDTDLSDPNEVLTFCLTLSAAATYMQRLCQQIIDARAAESE